MSQKTKKISALLIAAVLVLALVKTTVTKSRLKRAINSISVSRQTTFKMFDEVSKKISKNEYTKPEHSKEKINLNNIAYGKPVLPLSNSVGENIENITDGKPFTYWNARKNDEVRIDLGLVYNVHNLTLNFLKNPISNTKENLSVYYSVDGNNYFECKMSDGEKNSNHINARYFKLVAKTKLRLSSVEATGNPINHERKTILIVSAHPDDEALLGSGIIKRALDNHDEVYVLLATLGDSNGISEGKTRMTESITALTKLGLNKNNILFLDYPDDGGLWRIEDSMLYKFYLASNPDEVYTSRNGQNQTYNGTTQSYHELKFGRQAKYTRNNFFTDVRTALKQTDPDEIYTTSRFDIHGDHAYLGMFVNDVIIDIQKEDIKKLKDKISKNRTTEQKMGKNRNANTTKYLRKREVFNPTVYETMIHSSEGDKTWPRRKNGEIEAFSKPKNIEKTLLEWNKRTSITVPDEMKRPVILTKLLRDNNLKNQTLKRYFSKYFDYIGAYSKFDEIFWTRDYSSISYSARVTASSEVTNNDKSKDQSAAKVIDGIADGYSPYIPIPKRERFKHAEWASTGKDHQWIELKWDEKKVINSVKLYDRPNLYEHILSGKLVFSDGSEVKVGELPNNGKGLEIKFDKKAVDSVRFVIESTSNTTQKVGLAEFEVFGEDY
ncbi:MAG: PIG-L family deacetylase [Clostridioides sp.]|nr:PIG-L family deacetylase [Clostridioides sp.]